MFLLFVFIIFSILISRTILKSNIFNLASLSLIAYWFSYPIETSDVTKYVIENINAFKNEGIYLYAIFGFAFLLGVFICTKCKFKKLEFYPIINTEKNLLFTSIFLGFLGLLCFSYTHNFNSLDYLNSIQNFSRAERLSLLNTSRNALPYSIFFLPSVSTLFIFIKNFGLKKSTSKIFFIILILLINSPIFFSYLIEGDRTSLIKLFIPVIFILGLGKSSVETKNKKHLLIENFKINKKVLLNRIKITLILITLFFILTFIGLGRENSWKDTSRIFTSISERYKNKQLPVAEFRQVNYTIDYVLARDSLNIDKTDNMFTWDKFIFYPLPTYVYKSIFNEKKPPNIGRVIALETKNIKYGEKDNRKLGFGLSPIAEGYINFGYLGVFITGIVYGLAVGILQIFYNKISLERINLLDIFIINTLGIVPLIMRIGSAGIYNWIFSTSFVILLPLLIIDIFRRKKLQI